MMYTKLTELDELYLDRRSLEDAIRTARHYDQPLMAREFCADLKQVEERIAEIEIEQELCAA